MKNTTTKKKLVNKSRIEKDSIGNISIDSNKLWGSQTQRSVDVYQISPQHLSDHKNFIKNMVNIKFACAQANRDLGQISKKICAQICQACDQIIEKFDEYKEHFPVDMIQGGAGTSTNMNVNEVIANLSLKNAKLPSGSYQDIHPLDHINKSQSTNDVYPCAIKLTFHDKLSCLEKSVKSLVKALTNKAEKEKNCILIGRTQLQDAVPISGQQILQGYAVSIQNTLDAFNFAKKSLLCMHIGGTAVGTGINTRKGFAAKALKHLSKKVGLPLKASSHFVSATQDANVFVRTAHALQELSVSLTKLCNDIRLMSSGPQFGLGDLVIPEKLAGSSIMPGKVNPVIPEVVNQVCFAVFGHTHTVIHAASNGQLQLNAFEPIIARSIFESTDILESACRTLEKHCIEGMFFNKDLAKVRSKQAACLATALNPHIGYEKTTMIAKTAIKKQISVETVLKEHDLYNKEIEKDLDIKRMIKPKSK